MILVFDTNHLSDLLNNHLLSLNRLQQALAAKVDLVLTDPAYFELTRGLYKSNAITKLRVLETTYRPLFRWVNLEHSDWIEAAKWYAETRNKGRQLSDMDLLLASVTHRLGATLASSDQDFDVLPISRVDWREPSP